MPAPPPVATRDRVAAAQNPGRDPLRDLYFPALPSLTLGLVSVRDGRCNVGPLTLLRFAEPQWDGDSWSWSILGGLLAWPPGGRLRVGYRSGQLFSAVEDYWPSLPRPVYALTQLPVHHLLSRLILLTQRGRLPPVGVPAGPAERLAAAGLDAAICGLLATRLRRRRLRGLTLITVAYHLGSWSWAGRTLGGQVLGLRVVALDGSRPSLGQAVLRLSVLPLAAWRRRALHDEVARTDVVEAAYRGAGRG